LKQSVLVEVYQHICSTFEEKFGLRGASTEHAAPNMSATFARLLLYMQFEKTHEFVSGRSPPSLLPVFELGLDKWQSGVVVETAAVEKAISGQGSQEEGLSLEELDELDEQPEDWPEDGVEDEIDEDDLNIN
jgi:hypothetical protein